jgi:hypothetical protein
MAKKDKPIVQKKISNELTGHSGEYLAASELCRRGYCANITLKNTEGVDILATNENAARFVGIQVKTNQDNKKYWVLNAKNEKFIADHLFYVFINLNNQTGERPEIYVVPSKLVAKAIKDEYKEFIAKGGKAQSMRQFNKPNEKYQNNWHLLGLDS